ncbi:MAG: hypothetical protein WAM73_00785 [Desulfobacterales bacterium]
MARSNFQFNKRQKELAKKKKKEEKRQRKLEKNAVKTEGSADTEAPESEGEETPAAE